MKTIYLAGGCFWGSEQYLGELKGIISTQTGYILGKTAKTKDISLKETVSYEEVCGGIGHAECVKIIFDTKQTDLLSLLMEYSFTIDPTSLNKQGADTGIQYRTGIYYTDPADKETALSFLTSLQAHYLEPIQIEVLEVLQFIEAEEYHQKYLEKNPKGYCHISYDSINKKKAHIKQLEAQQSMNQETYQKPSQETLKEKLSPLQYAITQENKTEAPFENAYWDCFKEGIYIDITTGEPLFSSKDKFNSGCGWASFSKGLSDNLQELEDTSLHRTRTEIRSKNSDAHLGHVFDDGPEESGGLRYCINSGALEFIPKEDMEKRGYGKYLPKI